MLSSWGHQAHRTVDHLTGLLVGLETGHFAPSFDNPALFRGIHDGRYKFARYFKPSQHHMPRDWATLLKYNQLELYDTLTDPDEITNLAASPESHKDLILRLNESVNQSVDNEVGVDNGSEFPGPHFLYQRL